MSYMRDDEFYVWGGIDAITISKGARRTPEQQAAVARTWPPRLGASSATRRHLRVPPSRESRGRNGGSNHE